MRYLVFVTFLWAFSFSLIGVYLAGHVDNYFAVLTRILLAGALFVPFLRLRGLPKGYIVGLLAVGALQFGVTYLCLYRSFSYLDVPEVLLFTIFTPLYVALIDDLIKRRFSPGYLVATALAVVGAAIIRYDGITDRFIRGFLILQLANLAFAAGQVGYANLVRIYQIQRPQHQSFGLFFIGALLVALPGFLLFGNHQLLPSTSLQWGILGWLGLVASGLGFYLWNRGATKVDAGVLGVMNNALIPAGLIVNVVFWNHDANLWRLTLGTLVILASLWVNAHWPGKTGDNV